MAYEEDRTDEGLGLVVICLGTIAIVGMVFGLRIWDKAGADIRAANAQERIAEVLERRDGRPMESVGGYSFGPDWVCTKQSDQRTLCGRP